MKLWAFHIYVGNSSRYCVRSEIEGFDAKTRAILEARIKYLQISPLNMWNRPEAAKIVEYNLFEIRFKKVNVQCRPLGNFLNNSKDFVITLICTKKGSNYEPKNAFTLASKRLSGISDDGDAYSPLKINGVDYSKI